MRLSPWGRVVAISALLVVGGFVALLIGALASTHRVIATYPVTGTLEGLTFDVGAGNVEVVGGGRRDAVQVQRTERYAFGHRAVVQPAVAGAVYRVRARCPTSLLGACSVAYRVTVPDNVSLDI